MKRLLVAAEKGDANAQFNLGVLHDSGVDDNGHAVAVNRAEAIRWLLRAAQQGLPRAQSRLAQLYARAPGAPGNYVRACTWLILAMTSSSGIHRRNAQSGYAQISSQLTPAQIATAVRRAKNWKPKPTARTPGCSGVLSPPRASGRDVTRAARSQPSLTRT